MGTPLGPVKINVGDKVKDQFIVKKKIGEGACGQVYLVHVIDKDGKTKGKAAMKVEPLMKSKEDEILKMEIYVLKKIQNSRHVCRCLASGKASTYTYVVMSLLGKELCELRRRLPSRKMSTSSTLRISIQVIKTCTLLQLITLRLRVFKIFMKQIRCIVLNDRMLNWKSTLERLTTERCC
uniref:Protein kinase domain-containing protein n=1 Tax=Heterorhabditis bacteriophora TaxID=37862 RepID=A0A1I7XLN0_HETBA